VLTTGGTGPALRDVTPEATLAVAHKEMPGFGEQMRQISLRFVPTAILSRQVPSSGTKPHHQPARPTQGDCRNAGRPEIAEMADKGARHFCGRALLHRPDRRALPGNRDAVCKAFRPKNAIRAPRLLKYQPAQARVVSVAGDVRLGGARLPSAWPCPKAAACQTGANSSAVVELGDGTQVKLLPQTLADVVNNRDYAMRDASASGSTTWFSGLIRLTQGALETLAARVERRATPLQIETPTSLVGVRGTQFRVAYEDPATRNARTEVVEGLVRADNPAQQSGADLPGGTGALINPARARSARRQAAARTGPVGPARQMTLSRNWGLTLLESMFPLVATGNR
jgi:ferric-dicitrate binding protein FerR (iron transport regulator)